MTCQCPKCGARLKAKRAGVKLRCPRCGSGFQVAAATSAVEIPRSGVPAREAVAVEGPAPGAGAPRREFAGYELLGELGRGGMGIVYKARDPKLGRVVALKVLIAGEDASQDQIERFFREAESAAKLKHPNIVPIHELDTFEGKHYFTMDFIEGTPLNEVIEADDLTPREAMECMEQIARAVHHAHSQGIIHRDLKPSNIIISSDGRPMVMDFGLAREVEVESRLTRSGTAMGTPSYMSPEQAAGESHRTDARSDVYSLGAVLYEMLTGRPPFVGDNLMEILTAVAEEDPAPPQMVNPGVPEDADVICLKCLEKEPRRRYPTARKLADDCRRFLDGEAIAARPASVTYRMGKRLSRHKAVTAVTVLAALFVVALSAWYVVSLRQALRSEKEAASQARSAADREEKAKRDALAAAGSEKDAKAVAEAEAARARATVEFLRETLASADPAKSGREVTVAEVMDESARKVDGAFAGDDRVKADIHLTLGRTYLALGKLDRAEKHLKSAVALREGLFPADAPEKLEAGAAWGELLHAQGKVAEAEKVQREVLEARRRTLGPEHRDTLSSMGLVANTVAAHGRPAEAEKMHRVALEAQRRVLGPEHPDTLATMANLAARLWEQGRPEEAETIYRDLLKGFVRNFGKEHPDTLIVMGNLAATLWTVGKLDEAERMFREVFEARRRVLGAEHPSTLTSMDSYGVVMQRRGRDAEAEKLHREVLEARKRILGERHPETLTTMNNLVMDLLAEGKLAEAERLSREALEGFRRALGEGHLYTLLSMCNLALVLEKQGRLEEAVKIQEAAVALISKSTPENRAAMLRDALEQFRQALKNQGKTAPPAPVQ